MNYNYFFTFLFFSISLFAQESADKIIYLDSLVNFSTEANYTYKWIIKDYNNGEDLHQAIEYYKSGKIKTKGVTFSKKFFGSSFRYIDRIPLRDIIIEYYENGNKKTTFSYSNSDITKTYTWHENGQKKSETQQTQTKEKYESNSYKNWDHGTKSVFNLQLLQFWDDNGTQTVIDGNGKVEENNEDAYSKGKYVNGKKSGEWLGTDKKNNFTYTENYTNGILVSGKSTDSNNIEYNYTKEVTHAEPKKGAENFSPKLLKFIPNKAESILHEYFTFTVNTEGKIINVDTRNIKDEKNKKKVVEFLSKYQNWKPQEIRGIKTNENLVYSLH